MKIHTLILLALLSFSEGCKVPAGRPERIAENFDLASAQLQKALGFLGDTSMNPGYTGSDSSLVLVPSRNWISGFFPGNLWYMYEYSRDEIWKEAARHFTLNLVQEQYNGSTHDMGFKIFCSFGNAYRLTGQKEYRDVLIQAAGTLITRFNPVVGCIRSWDHNQDKWDYPVIIDNMMNLELLFWAAKETGDPAYYKVALSHAEVTLRDHFRPDNSSYHVVSYDTLTGQVVKKNTHQGYSDESAWARGQAWGLYGFTMTYRETGEERFLGQARKIADYILGNPNLPRDMIPYWDFNAPDIPDASRDASAAAITASALYELSTYCPAGERDMYLRAANRILQSLSSPEFLAEPGTNNFFLLKHSVGNFPRGLEVNVPLVYTDYYFLEANLRKMKLSGVWRPEASVVIKVDDLRYVEGGPVSPRWQNFTYLVERKKSPVAVGIICNSLEQGNEDYISWIRERQKTGCFEFWNHGYDHKKGIENAMTVFEFRQRSLEEQFTSLKKCQVLSREKIGNPFASFGAPYNQTDHNTVAALEQFPEIRIWLYGPEGTETGKIILPRIPELNIEYPVHRPVFYHFWNNFYFHSSLPVITLQGHPNSWDESGLREFERFLDYLNAIGVPLILPSSLDRPLKNANRLSGWQQQRHPAI